MGIDKKSGDVLDSFNRTLGADTRLVFFKDWSLDAHIAGTHSPGNPSGANDVGASLAYRSNWVDGIVERRRTGQNYNPEVGVVDWTASEVSLIVLTFMLRTR